MDMEKKFEELGRAFEDFKKLNDQKIKAIESKGSAPGDLIEKLEKADAHITRLETEVKQMQAAMNRQGQSDVTKNEVEQKAMAHKQAFEKFVRKGNDTELKSLSVGTDADGGYLVPEEMSSEIVKAVYESSPLRQLASVQTISTDTLEMITDLGEMTSGWVAETAARTATNTAQIGKLSFSVHELYANPQITQKLLDDAAFNMEAWINQKVSEKFARAEATAFISGDGSAKPKGILAYTAGTGTGEVEQIAAADDVTIVGDDLVNLQAAVKEAYQANSVFLMNRSTVKMIRKLKDSNGLYLWQPSLQLGASDSILGKPVMMASDMPAVAASALSVAYGDFKQAYQIIDRVGIRVLRDPFTNKPYVGFYTTKRVGGGVKDFSAFKILAQAAS